MEAIQITCRDNRSIIIPKDELIEYVMKNGF